MDDSVVSSVTDKFGFIHSEAGVNNEDKEDNNGVEEVDIDLLRLFF